MLLLYKAFYTVDTAAAAAIDYLQCCCYASLMQHNTRMHCSRCYPQCMRRPTRRIAAALLLHMLLLLLLFVLLLRYYGCC